MSEVPVNATGAGVAGTPPDLSLAPKLGMMARKAVEDARNLLQKRKSKYHKY